MPLPGVRIERVRMSAVLRALGGKRPPARILSLLRLRAGGWVSTAEIIDYAWGDDEDGGPLDAPRAVYVHIHNLRRAGAVIESVVGRGSRGYRLISTPHNGNPHHAV